MSAGDAGLVTVFLCGDVMTGRGVDQVLPHPGDPRLWEAYTRDARAYVSLAEAANGPIPAPVAFRWPWGDALDVLADIGPELRVVNLETSITRSDDVAVGKAVTYRMNPANIGCLTAAAPDVCALANNHILDFGYRGLDETLETLAAANISAVGAGRDVNAAGRPAAIPRESGGRFLVFSVGLPSSGIPENWGATRERPGVSLVPEPATAAATIARIAELRRPDDIVIVSVHWGSNWGYEVPRGQVAFAHQLVDGGVDIVHGHSSHHPRPVEVYRGRLILYGCGDFIDDYEGIGGHEEYRDDLRLLYFVTVKAATGQLVALRAVPMRARQLRLHRASLADTAELAAVLSRISHDLGARFDRAPDGALALQAVPPA